MEFYAPTKDITTTEAFNAFGVSDLNQLSLNSSELEAFCNAYRLREGKESHYLHKRIYLLKIEDGNLLSGYILCNISSFCGGYYCDFNECSAKDKISTNDLLVVRTN